MPVALANSGAGPPDAPGRLMKSDTPVNPLAGLRVLELTHTVMGPVAGLVLAELGADGIKIEPAPDGDTTRALEGFAAGFSPLRADMASGTESYTEGWPSG